MHENKKQLNFIQNTKKWKGNTKIWNKKWLAIQLKVFKYQYCDPFLIKSSWYQFCQYHNSTRELRRVYECSPISVFCTKCLCPQFSFRLLTPRLSVILWNGRWAWGYWDVLHSQRCWKFCSTPQHCYQFYLSCPLPLDKRSIHLLRILVRVFLE